MHAERWGETSWSRLPFLRIKKAKALVCCKCSSNYFPNTQSALSSKLNTLNTWMHPTLTDISKVRQQHRQPCCCPASPFGTGTLLHNPSCFLELSAATFRQEWLAKEREWWFSLGSYCAIQMQVLPPRRSRRDTVHKVVPSSQMHLFPWP